MSAPAPRPGHCYHETTERVLAAPRRRRERCCFCGAVREVHLVFADRQAHGPHGPPEVEAVEVHGPDAVCPARAQDQSAA